MSKAREVFAQMIAQIDRLPHPPLTGVEAYEQRMVMIRTLILDSPHPPSFKYLLQRLLQTYSRQYLADGRLDAQPFFAPVRLARPKSRRSERGFRDLPLMRHCEALFRDAAASAAKNQGTAPGLWLALICWSAATRGFLLEPELIEALAWTVCHDERLLKATQDRHHVIRLFVPRRDLGHGRGMIPAHNCNWRQGAARGRVHYWYPDPVSLALIMNLRDCPKFILGDTVPIDGIFVRGGGILPFASLAALTQSAVWYLDEWKGLALPEAVTTALSGAWSVTGLDDTAFAALHFRRRNHQPAPKEATALARRPNVLRMAQPDQFERLRAVIADAKPAASTALVAELNAIIAQSESLDITRILAEWLREALLAGGVKVATVKSYLSRIGPRLIAEFGESDLVGVCDEDFLEAYRACIAATRSRENAILVSQLLAQFHRFAVRRFGLPELDEGISELSSMRMVRARHLRHDQVRAVYGWLKAQVPTPWSRAASFATLLAFRCGLRLGEICGLRPIDFEMSEQMWLFVRPTSQRGLKTEAARRKIPLRSILTDTECTYLEGMLEKTRAHPRASILESLVGWAIDPREISRLVSQALRETVGGEAWTFHHLRHMAANNLLLVALDETALCERYANWDGAKQNEVLLAFVPSARARQLRFTGMSAFLGHARVQQTFESYLHIVPEIVAHRRKGLTLGDDRAILLALLKRKRTQLHKSATIAEGYRMLGSRLQSLVLPEITDVPNSASPRSSILPTHTFENLSKFVVGQLWNALSHVERGWSCEAAAEEFGLDGVRFGAVVERCRALADLRTKRGQRRLIAQDRINAPAMPLVPPMPPAKREGESARFFLEKLLAASIDPASAEGVSWLVSYVTTHSDVNNTGVPFREVSDLQRTRAILNGAGVPDRLLHVEFRLPGKKMAEEWNGAVAGLNFTPPREDRKRAHAAWAKGHVRLIVERPDSQVKAKLRTTSRRSSSGWRFAIYMIAALEPWGQSADDLWHLFRGDGGSDGGQAFARVAPKPLLKPAEW